MDYYLRFKVSEPQGRNISGQYIIFANSRRQAEEEGNTRALKDKIAPYYFTTDQAKRFKEIVKSDAAQFEMLSIREL